MLTTNFTELFKLIAESWLNYVVFICILACIYYWIVFVGRFITDCIVKIVLAIRAPIQMGLPKDIFENNKEDEK